MNFRKKLAALALCILSVFSLSAGAAAAGTEGMDNFSPSKEYAGFPDVPESAWFYGGVKTSYEYDLVNGNARGEYLPKDNISLASSIVIACKINSIYSDNGASFEKEEGEVWYAPYVDYAIENGIIGASDYTSYTASATRGQFAEIMAKALPDEALSPINSIDNIPDVNIEDPHAEAIYKLYNAGVIAGNSEHCYMPGDNISRGAIASIITHMVNESEREVFTISQEPEPSPEPTPEPDPEPSPEPEILYTAFSYCDTAITSPSTTEDYRSLWRYMMKNGITEYTFARSIPRSASFENEYDAITESMEYGYDMAAEDLFQYQAFYGGYSYTGTATTDRSGTVLEITLILPTRDNFSKSSVKKAIAAFDAECESVVKSMYDRGVLTKDSSEKDIITAFYKYVDGRFTYRLACNDTSPYKAITTNTAVCEGYTAFLNGLCHTVGIPMKGQFGTAEGGSHVWSKLETGNGSLHTDCTWGDQYFCDTRYILLSETQLKGLDPTRTFTSWSGLAG